MKSKKLQRFTVVLAAVVCLLCISAQGVFAYDWSNFRGNAENNGVVNYKTPRTADEAVLSWAFSAGDGWDNAPSCPIIVNDTVVFAANTTLYQLDRVSGEVLQTGELRYRSDFNITPPTYAKDAGENGMIFVGLSNGQVQAFDAKTLESLWIYKDPLGGQVNCPITYHDGYIYTGFWNSDEKVANFACIPVNKTGDTQKSAWVQPNKGGYYWAGSYVNDNYVVVGGDDGAKADLAGSTSDGSYGNAPLRSFNPKTGEPIDSVSGIVGDIRSTICYDNGYIYFTSRAKTFYRIAISDDGKFGEVDSLVMDGNCTSTPVIYNGRAYIGVMGSGQFDPYSGHHIAVIDLNAWKVAYKCETRGYPQTSGLLTTAYEDAEGYVYVYFFDNKDPGVLRVLKDKAGQTEAITVDESVKTAPILFTPAAAQAQYAICSPICDEYGTIYFKNDSGYIMALTSAPTRLDCSSMPSKTHYLECDSIDNTGMDAKITYANGETRDVSKYMKANTDSLALDDIEVTMTYPYVMYQDSVYTKDELADIENDSTITDKVMKKDSNHSGVKLNVPYYQNGQKLAEAGYSLGNITVEPSAVALKNMVEANEGKLTKIRVNAFRAKYNTLSSAEQAKVETDILSVMKNAEEKLAAPFSDVKSGIWYEKAVEFANLNALMNGVGGNKFDGDGITTRAQLVTILYRYAGSPDVSGSAPFTDVKADEWYTDAVNWAYEKEVVNGVDDTHFGPNATLTREQLVTILYRYVEKPDVSEAPELTNFSDAGRISSYAKDAMKWGVKENMINGFAEGQNTLLRPQGDANRAQIATIMMRFIDPTAENEGK